MSLLVLFNGPLNIPDPPPRTNLSHGTIDIEPVIGVQDGAPTLGVAGVAGSAVAFHDSPTRATHSIARVTKPRSGFE